MTRNKLLLVARNDKFCISNRERKSEMKTSFLFAGCILIATQSYALKNDPSYRDARRNGAMAKIELRIVNDDGVPVPYANVNVFMGMNFRPKGYYLKGMTDANGIYVAEGKTCGDEIVVEVAKRGHYSSVKKLCFAKMGAEHDVRNGKWLPFNEVENITLRRIAKPIKLIAFDRLIDVAQTNAWLGFDMEKMDFVKPIGNGSAVDFEIKVEWDGLPAWESKSCSAEIRFLGDGTGGCYTKNVPESAFPYTYSAQPDAVYAERIVRIVDRNGDPHTTKIQFATDSALVTRTRCMIDEYRKIKVSNYGCIRRFEIGPSRRGVALLRLTYVFNPTPNDINLESK